MTGSDSQASSRRSSRFGFCKDVLFIFSGVGPPLCFWQLLLDPAERERPNRHPLWLSLHCGSLRSPSLRSAPAKAPGERTTPREFISAFFFLALLIN
jgi:hypothetical protein